MNNSLDIIKKSEEFEISKASVLIHSEPIFKNAVRVVGLDHNKYSSNKKADATNLTIEDLVESMYTTGFQATNFALAVNIINEMKNWRLPDELLEKEEYTYLENKKEGCTIFLGYTSNLVSSGVRESIRYLVQHKKVSCIVTTAGGVEEDIIKCLDHTYLGSFELDGSELRKKGLNRIGNLLIPNNNYCKFEDWIIPILDTLLEEQKKENKIWTPSSIIHRLGKEINSEESICYWAYKNEIPIFCPALTDGSMGDMIYFHSFRNPGLIIDIASDIRSINTISVRAKCTGMIILGGGIVKHHIANANLMRNGADYAVYINTEQEFDGSDSGARPDEAVSWGKIKSDAKMVKLYTDASIVFPLIVAVTFAKN
ncbi:deoxyhypusine synthase [Pneumocystis murina B123]|uniref:deoxyhypusine synthase n=1 Tax=Pneumocystis murina (strain B123) TaxID=1069680 RepID=M7NQA6_PNEMU|nr:deoxyhypusine synthase [Pneumocystis murina B123]EMR09261.1 deoxyhypusine synthase [Pneumocystis murina B123]